MITVKAELASRLLDVDPDRARAELADLERLSRDALADVRRAVEGYRDLTLPGELARARVALQAADIEADLPNSTDEVPSELRELFAWTVREGVTNVIRHSGARAARCGWPPTASRSRDDGTGPAEQRRARHTGSPACASGRRPPAPVLVTRTGCEPAGFALAGERPMTATAIRLLLADDQALVRGALAALLDLEPDLDVVAEVGRGDEVVAAAARAPARRGAARRGDARAGRHRGDPGAEGRRCPRRRVLIVTTFGRPGLPAPGDAGRARTGSWSRTPRPASWPTPYAGCTPVCGSSTRCWPRTAWSPASRR